MKTSLAVHELHRAACAPVWAAGETDTVELIERVIEAVGEQALFAFLRAQGLAPLWSSRADSMGVELSSSFREALKRERLQQTGRYMIQHRGLSDVRVILEAAGVEHLVIKGANTRERLYDEPALRPAVDIDVLVARECRARGIDALVEAGFELHENPSNISHEVSLVRGALSVDLHWDFMRPGRTRVPLAQSAIESRVDCGTHWGGSVLFDLMLALVHPVITKYATTPQASLVRVVDLHRLLNKAEVLESDLVALLERSGLKTAAWYHLRWLALLRGRNDHARLAMALQPGRARRRYLEMWLAGNLPARLQHIPALVPMGLTLAVHDRPSDLVVATRGIISAATSRSSRTLH